jgi:hypothetical protein
MPGLPRRGSVFREDDEWSAGQFFLYTIPVSDFPEEVKKIASRA